MNDSRGNFSEDEKILLKLLKEALKSQRSQPKVLEQVNWKEIFGIAKRHSVLSLLYDVLSEQNLPDKEKRHLEKSARGIVLQNYRLLFLSRHLIKKLEEQGIMAVLLKGAAASACYPVPELRKSGDVDLLLPRHEMVQQACARLKEDGFKVKDEQRVLHHIVLQSPEGIDVELHTMLAEPFEDEKVNSYIRRKTKECSTHSEKRSVLGVELTVLEPAFQAYELLLHMLQHFLRSGFGLKLLCDWVVFWNQGIDKEAQEYFVQMVQESKIQGFADMVTAVCIEYLGLDKYKTPWLRPQPATIVDKFMREILDAEEFGKSQAERMVAMRGSGIRDFAREFHHQMKLNFPNAGRVVAYWPVLWIITFYRFWRNNIRLRGVSSITVLQKAKERSQLIDKMRIFQTKSGEIGKKRDIDFCREKR